jgi:outer membrane protein assembly factor BamB
VAVSPGGGTVFVTGTTAEFTRSADYATVAYNAATGARLWASRYNGPANGQDSARSLAVSPDGATVFVTGTSGGTTSIDFATVAYNAATGARRWASRYNGPANGQDVANSLTVSPDGAAVFVTGTSQGDYGTVAYNAATGAQLWASLYNGPASRNDYALSVAVSPGGAAVFVTGYSQGGGSGFDYATVAYSTATGARRWASRYNAPANRGDRASSLAVSPGGATVFVTGSSRGRTSGQDYATVAYNAATGARRWASRYNAPANRDDRAASVAAGPGGHNVFVTGYSQGATSGFDYATLAYNAATGARRWASRYNGPQNKDDAAVSVAAGPGGHSVFVTGTSAGVASGPDYATLAYNAATGARRWAGRYNGPQNGNDFASSLAVSPGGSAVFVTGTTAVATSNADYATIAYQR